MDRANIFDHAWSAQPRCIVPNARVELQSSMQADGAVQQ